MDMQTIDRTKLKGDIAVYNKFKDEHKGILSIKDLLNIDDTVNSQDRIDTFTGWRTGTDTNDERPDPIEVWHKVADYCKIENYEDINTDYFTEEDWNNIVDCYEGYNEDKDIYTFEHKLSPEAQKLLENKRGVKNKCFTND